MFRKSQGAREATCPRAIPAIACGIVVRSHSQPALKCQCRYRIILRSKSLRAYESMLALSRRRSGKACQLS